MSKRQSRRTRGERPELVPPKSDEEPDLEDDYIDENGNIIALGAIRGYRRGKRVKSKDGNIAKIGSSSSLSKDGNITKRGSSSSLSQLADKKPPKKLPQAATAPRKRRGRPPKMRSAPAPSQMSVSSSMSASGSMDDDEDDGTTDSGKSSDLFESDSSDSDNDDDDAERDTEDDAPKEALTAKKKVPKKLEKKQQGLGEAPHPRYKNVVKIACRHCGKLCFSQGLKTHERSCMPVYTPRVVPKKAVTKTKTKKQQPRRKRFGRPDSSSDSQSSSSSSSDSSDSSSPPSPVVIVRKKAPAPKKSPSVKPREKGSYLVSTDPVKQPFICRSCGRFFTLRGINAHEKRCMPVYTERLSMVPDIPPDIQPKQKKEKEPSDSESKYQEHETSSSSEAENNGTEAPTAPKTKRFEAEINYTEAPTTSETKGLKAENNDTENPNAPKAKGLEAENNGTEVPAAPETKGIRWCKYCGKNVSSRGYRQHEKSCAKKARARDKLIAEEKEKGETKKKKRKLSDMGAEAIATTTDDDLLWEDDASSATKTNVKSAKDTTINAGEGKIAQGNTAIHKNRKNPPPGISLTVPPKRKRRRKISDTKVDEEGNVSNVEMKVVDVKSSGIVGENPTRKKTRKTKPEIVVAQKAPKAVIRPKNNHDGLPATSLVLAPTTKVKKKSSILNKGVPGSEKEKTITNPSDLKAAKKGEKKKGAKKSTTPKGKVASITTFFSPKKSPAKQQTKLSASREGGEVKPSNKRNSGVGSAVGKEERSSTSTEEQSFSGGTIETGKQNDKKVESIIKIGKNKGQKSMKIIKKSVLKTIPAKKKHRTVVMGGDKKVPSTASKVTLNKVKSAAINDVTKEKPNSAKMSRESYAMIALAKPIDRENSTKLENFVDSGRNYDSNKPKNKGKTTSRKSLEKKEKSQNKLTPTSRPTRKRKLTQKAAETAAIAFIKNEEKRIRKNESDVAEGSGPVLGKKPKINHDDELVSSNPSYSNRFTASDAKRATATPPKDLKAKAGIVEAAKNAAAATLAAFSMFAAKPKLIIETKPKKTKIESVESPPVVNAAEKPTASVVLLSNTISKKRAQYGDESREEAKEIPLVEVKKTKPTEVVPTSADTTSLQGKEAVSTEDVTTEALKNDSDQTVYSSAATDELTIVEKQQVSPSLNAGESPTAIHTGEPKETANVTNLTDQSITTAKAENEMVRKTHQELNSKEDKSSTATEKIFDVHKMETNATEGDSLSLTKEETPKPENSPESKDIMRNEMAEFISDANSVVSPLSKIDSIPVLQDNSPNPDEVLEDTSTADPDKAHLNERDASKCEENRAESQESTPATEDLRISTNDSQGGTGTDQGNKKDVTDPQQSELVEKAAKYVETEMIGEEKVTDPQQQESMEKLAKEIETGKIGEEKVTEPQQPELVVKPAKETETGNIEERNGTDPQQPESVDKPVKVAETRKIEERNVIDPQQPELVEKPSKEIETGKIEERNVTDCEQLESVEKSSKEAETEKIEERKLEEKDKLQLPANTVQPKTSSVDEPHAQSPIVTEHGIVEKGNDEEMQKPEEVRIGETAAHGEVDEIRDGISAVEKEKEPLSQGDEEIESDLVVGVVESTVPKEEAIRGISSDDLGADPQDLEDGCKKTEKGDTEHSVNDCAEAEVGIQGKNSRIEPNATGKSQDSEGQNDEELLHVALEKPKETVEEDRTQSKSEISSSTDLVEPVTAFMEIEPKSEAEIPNNATAISYDAISADRSSKIEDESGSRQDLIPTADKSNHLQDTSSTSTDAPNDEVITNNGDVVVSEVLETNSIKQQSTKLEKYDPGDVSQVSDVSKRESLNADIAAVNISPSETPSQTEKPSESVEDPVEDTAISRAEIAMSQPLESSIDWKETVSIQTKTDIAIQDLSSNTPEDKSKTTPVNIAEIFDINEVATDEREGLVSKATCENTDDQDSKLDVGNDPSEKNIEVKESDTGTANKETNDDVMDKSNATETQNVATESNEEEVVNSGLSQTTIETNDDAMDKSNATEIEKVATESHEEEIENSGLSHAHDNETTAIETNDDAMYNSNTIETENVVVESDDKETDNSGVSHACANKTTAIDTNDDTMDNSNTNEIEKVATESDDKEIGGFRVPHPRDNEIREDEGKPSEEISNQVENLDHNVTSIVGADDDRMSPGRTGLESIEKNLPALNFQEPEISLVAHNGSLQSDSVGQESATNEADSASQMTKSQVKNIDGESIKIEDNEIATSSAEQSTTEAQSRTTYNIDDPECEKYEGVKGNEQSQEVLSRQNNTILSQTELQSTLETPTDDMIDLDAEKERKTSDADIVGKQDNEGKDLSSTKASNVVDRVKSELHTNSSQVDEDVVPIKSMELPTNNSITKIDVTYATRKDVSATIESLLNAVESRISSKLIDTTHMDIDILPGPSAEIVAGHGTPMFAISANGANSISKQPDSTMDVEVGTESIVKPEDGASIAKEVTTVSWIAMSKFPRQSKPVKDTPRFNRYDENKMNRVKMLLYTSGSKIHRGRGFERIFGMYWDAICLRISRPLNINTSKRCDEAISGFLKSRRLRKIHNKLVMSIMRRALKNRVPYSEVVEHVPKKWQDRVKVPRIVTTRNIPKKKNVTIYGVEDEWLRILSNVPHIDETTPYKERWELSIDADDETQQIPQEGPSAPIASSCIPGALVVDPMLRETVEASGMKVTDNAMWLLTVALKEHIKNILNDSIEYKKGLKKGEIFPQAIHYPNVLASSSNASSSNKNRKISKGKTSAASLDNGRKQRINSIDLFAALNMLPSGQPSSIGGSVSRVSLEQTFLSGFNSIPAFDTGNAFKDVLSFVSNTITIMAKDRKPEEKKAKSSHTKSAENQTSRSRQAKPVSLKEGIVKTPPSHRPSLPSSTNTSESIATPLRILKSPPLTHNLSPAVIQTPALDSPSPKIDISQLVSENQKHAKTSSKASSASGPQGIEEKALVVIEEKAPKIEKPNEKATAVVLPSQSGPQRSGAGRGAKNLAALMARASESSSQKDLTQGGDNTNDLSEDNKTAPSTATAKVETNESNLEKPKSKKNTEQSLQSDADPLKQNIDSSKDAESTPEITADVTKMESSDGAADKERSSVPAPQSVVPIRRGKGKGFGLKDLAAMRARATSGGVDDPNSADK